MLRRLRPRHDAFTLLARAPGPIDVPAGSFTFISVGDGSTPDLPALAAFCDAQGFPPDWARDMLADGCRAIVARDAGSAQVAAMAWTATRPFHVDEIRVTLIPPPGGSYLFGDFVAAAFRGQGLQAQLVARRLATDPSRLAVTLIHPSNVASMRSYARHGFVPVATLRTRTWGPFFGTRAAVPEPGAAVGTQLRGRTLRIGG